MNGEPRIGVQLSLEDLLGLATSGAKLFHPDAPHTEPQTLGEAERQGVLACLWPLWSSAPGEWRVSISGAFGSLGDEWVYSLDRALSAARVQHLERMWDASEDAA